MRRPALHPVRPSATLPPYRPQQIAYCGVCHSDLHTIKGEWGKTAYPIVGIVTEVGSAVGSEFAVGEAAAVGCMVDSCGACDECHEGLEQYCANLPTWTYNSKDRADGTTTQASEEVNSVLAPFEGGFALHFPAGLPLDAGAPLLCAGITTYSPLRHFGLDQPGMRLGVVTVISTSPSKREEALHRLKADRFVVRRGTGRGGAGISRNEDEMKAAAGTLHGIIDTVSAAHDLSDYLALLKSDGKLVMVGLPPQELPIRAVHLSARRRLLAGSSIGGIKETQARAGGTGPGFGEMLDFCAAHGIVCDIERIGIDYINSAMERLLRNDVHYRFVIDVQGSLVLEGGAAA
eukprot:scaffold2.g7098.t1